MVDSVLKDQLTSKMFTSEYHKNQNEFLIHSICILNSHYPMFIPLKLNYFVHLDLSFQAGQKVMSAPVEDSLQYLRDISQNFPTQARSV